MQDVATLAGVLDRRVLELGKVLTGEGEDGGSAAGLDGDEVGGRGLVSVCGAPELQVRDGAQVDGDFDGLMCWAILTETDRVVSGDPDDLVAGEGRQTESTNSVADEVL